jgi:deoxyadenosine/deoxycytidine kinase
MVFAETNLQAGSLEMASYDVAYAELLACLPQNADIHFAYLETTVDVISERIQRRNRAAEVNAIMHEYLHVLNAAHERMLGQFVRGSVTPIDASLPANDVANQVARLVAHGINKRPYVHPAMLNGGLVQTWGPVQRPKMDAIEWPKSPYVLANQGYAFDR